MALSAVLLVALVSSTPLGPETVHNEAGFVDLEFPPRKFFYWYFESRNDPSTDPLILWMSGGPGCSSQLALYAENGPYKIESDGSVSLNPYSWNSNATVLWLDQPAGTGFSSGFPEWDSEQVGDTITEVIEGFLTKHPKYKELPFFVFGESYAGHYVPAVAHQILLKMQSKETFIKLAGAAIGNGMTAPGPQFEEYITFTKEHNLESKKVEFIMEAAIAPCEALIAACHDHKFSGAMHFASCMNALTLCEYSQILPVQLTGINLYDIRKQCTVPPLCYDFSPIENYLNRKDVQASLGVDTTYKTCNPIVNLEFISSGDWLTDFQPEIKGLLEAGIPVLIYAGEYDFICNWRGNYRWVSDLKWSGAAGFAQATNSTWEVDGKTAGYLKSSGGLAFLKVLNAGHMSPMDQPENTLAMVQSFTQGGHAALLKNGREVADMGESSEKPWHLPKTEKTTKLNIQ